MDQDFPFHVQTAVRHRSSWRTIAIAVLAAFLLGVIAAWLLLRPSDLGVPELVSIKSEQSAPAADAADAAAAQVGEFVGQQGELGQRMSEMEQRLARIDVQADAAAGNAARAEGLLIAFAARRAVERGDRLGYLADQLQMRFGAAEPAAVQAVLAADRDSVTLDQLLAQLDGLAPHLGQGRANEDTLAWLSREMSQLFVVRREGAPSPAPERRLERARQFLESGRTEAAIAEVRNLPNADRAGGWLADAERYAAAQRGLERLEAAAILAPKRLRDGQGQPVQPPAPATGP
jgi:hypothetical protein